MFTAMDRQKRIPMREKAEQALADIGGDPLTGSGFEDEMPEVGFSDNAPAARRPER